MWKTLKCMSGSFDDRNFFLEEVLQTYFRGTQSSCVRCAPPGRC